MTRLTEMETFATVVEEGGFTGAARKLGVSKSSISKHITALENRLGARLLSRTTRRVNPTEIGLAYFDRASRILNDAGDADALVAELHATPSGALQISTTNDFGIHVLAPLTGKFLAGFPDISINLELADRDVDLIGENFDLEIRVGCQKDCSLRARKLTEVRMRLVASPGYLETNGSPGSVSDLANHQLLNTTNRNGGNVWKLVTPDVETRNLPTHGGFSINDGQSLLNAAIDGLGIACLPDFLTATAMHKGLVADALPSLAENIQPVYAIYPPGRFTQPKVRAYIDFLVCELNAGLPHAN